MIRDSFLESYEWRTVRMRVLERDGAKCACCGATARNGAVMNVDHIKPRRAYPELALTESNLQVLCGACNHGKGNKYETDWRGPNAAATLGPWVAPSPDELAELSPQETERLRQLEIVRGSRMGPRPNLLDLARKALADTNREE